MKMIAFSDTQICNKSKIITFNLALFIYRVLPIKTKLKRKLNMWTEDELR